MGSIFFLLIFAPFFTWKHFLLLSNMAILKEIICSHRQPVLSFESSPYLKVETYSTFKKLAYQCKNNILYVYPYFAHRVMNLKLFGSLTF